MKTEKKRKKIGLDDELPRLASDILALDPDYKDPRYNEVTALKATIRDEVAMARCLARRGLPPEEPWKEDPDDPRLESWRKTHEDSIELLTTLVSNWALAEDHMTHAGLKRLAEMSRRLHEVAQIVISGHETKR